MEIIEAIVRFRAGGYEETLGFTVYDTLRYRDALEPLVAEEVRVLLDRLAGEVSPTARSRSSPRAPSRCASSSARMHSKLLLAELQRVRGG